MILPEFVEEHPPEGGATVLIAFRGAGEIVAEEIDGEGFGTGEGAERDEYGPGGTRAWTKR